MRFEKAVFADGFHVNEEFTLTNGFLPLTFNLSREEAEVLAQATESLTILDSNFAGLALTANERRIEQELKDNCGAILAGRKEGWILLGCREIYVRQVSGLSAAFYVFHVASRLSFVVKLSERKLSQYDLESKFRCIMSDMVNGRLFNN